MANALSVSIGQYSDKGRKAINQDFNGAFVPSEPVLSLKGVAVVLADGISTSEVSHIASQTAVKSFLADYYSTPDAWSVKTSAQRVVAAVNSWLHAQTRHGRLAHDRDCGHVCTLSALVVRSTTAHIFHVGDARIYRLAGEALEQLTEDHRVVVSSSRSYLGRAVGANHEVEIDYRAVSLGVGDVFVLVTDGVHEHVGARRMAAIAAAAGADPAGAAQAICEEAVRQGSPDNVTAQIVRIDALPVAQASEILAQDADFPPAPLLDAGQTFEGYRIVREIHASSRSHIYLAIDAIDGASVALKVPALAWRDDDACLRRFRMEEWVGRRIASPHVLAARAPSRRRGHLYVVTEFIDGQTLTQWMRDNPTPPLAAVRDIVEQIAKGLQAFHRLEMLHQDLRPDNVMIDRTGTAKMIDFGSTCILGLSDDPADGAIEILGTAQYTAPEYLLGDGGSQSADIFSLGVIAYQMLTGRLPYGAEVAKARTWAQLRKLRYHSARDAAHDVPAWIDATLHKAVALDPGRRYDELSEFVFDLRHPNTDLEAAPRPWLERNPLRFWQACSALLLVAVVALTGFVLTQVR
jgi:serine/threonine protein phosphatase PrpC